MDLVLGSCHSKESSHLSPSDRMKAVAAFTVEWVENVSKCVCDPDKVPDFQSSPTFP